MFFPVLRELKEVKAAEKVMGYMQFKIKRGPESLLGFYE